MMIGLHLLRIVLVVAVIASLSRLAGRRWSNPDIARRIRYAVAGLILGATWVWRESNPAWEHALRLAIVLIVIGPLLRLLRGRPAFNWKWLVAKFALVMTGLGTQWLLEQWSSRTAATVTVAIAVGAAVALVGPLLHRPLTAAGDLSTPLISGDPPARQLAAPRR
ncbi:MAG TPA: hypothetical protein VHV79_02980 [Mycobacteriales bacterium]|jgi:hypothetical protein|nr:hypothetical protein [Mycobacteriales bacterium]